MKIYINTWCPMDQKIGAACRSVANGARIGCAVNDNSARIIQDITDIRKYFSTAIILVAPWDWRRPDGTTYQERNRSLEPEKENLANQCAMIINTWRDLGGRDEDLYIEFGPELDGSWWKRNLGAFHRTAMVSYERIRSISSAVHFVTGSTMNLNKEFSWKKGGYEILEECCALPWPADTLQGLHPYRNDTGRKWPSFDSDASTLAALRKMLADRTVAITEMGWYSGAKWTDAQIARFVREEIRIWENFGSPVYSHYQIQDGPSPDANSEGHFGAYTNIVDGLLPKPVAASLKEAKEKLT